MKRLFFRSGLLPVLIFSVLGFFTMGYHPGAEDDAVYLSAVKARLNPSLYPHDSPFFALQMRGSVFDAWMAGFVRATGISIPVAELLWQCLSIVLIVWAGWKIVSNLFDDKAARWGGTAMLSAMLTLPVAGTSLFIADQYLHPRNPATALILFAIERIQPGRLKAGRRWQAAPLLLVSFLLHPLMGAMGASFCVVLWLTHSEAVRARVLAWKERRMARPAEAALPAAAVFPFAWLFKTPQPAFLDALRTRHAYLLFQWTWYEWLGVIGPLVIFWAIARVARRQQNQSLARFATAVLIYSVFQQVVAMLILGQRQFASLYTLEPMRYLQLVYIFLVLIAGAYIGLHLLKSTPWRWTAFLLLANGGMAYAQRDLFPATEHIELPGAAPVNPWVQAFEWIRQNTPRDAYFAIDPYYMHAPGNDNHSFRAIAERSVLADAVKDTAVVTKTPEIASAWERQANAAAGWNNFHLADFERLKAAFGVDWALVSNAQTAGLDCRWHNRTLAVCRIP